MGKSCKEYISAILLAKSELVKARRLLDALCGGKAISVVYSLRGKNMAVVGFYSGISSDELDLRPFLYEGGASSGQPLSVKIENIVDITVYDNPLEAVSGVQE